MKDERSEADAPRRVLIQVVEVEGGRLLALDGDGEVVATYRRTVPADPSRDSNWADELVTDVAGLTRVGVREVARRMGEKVKGFAVEARQQVAREGEGWK